MIPFCSWLNVIIYEKICTSLFLVHATNKQLHGRTHARTGHDGGGPEVEARPARGDAQLRGRRFLLL